MDSAVSRAAGTARDRTGRTGAAAGLTVGLSVYAGLMLVMMGILQGLEGLAALLHGDFFAASARYAFRFEAKAWGIVFVLLGLAAVAVGIGVLLGVAAARLTAMVVAFVTAIANFLFIPYYPVWAVVLIAVDLAVIWALAGFEPRRA